MFTVNPDEATEIQTAYRERSEVAAIDAMRRLFPALQGSDVGPLTRIIAGWNLERPASPEPT